VSKSDEDISVWLDLLRYEEHRYYKHYYRFKGLVEEITYYPLDTLFKRGLKGYIKLLINKRKYLQKIESISRKRDKISDRKKTLNMVYYDEPVGKRRVSKVIDLGNIGRTDD